MFEFFKDSYLELAGVDLNKSKVADLEKKNEKILIPKSIRILITVFALLAIPENIFLFMLYYADRKLTPLIGCGMQILMCTAILLLLTRKTKITEGIVLVMCVVFLMLRVFSVAIAG